MFTASSQRLDGIEDIFKGIVAFGAGTALPLYTQYKNLQLLKQQSEFQRQTQSAMPTSAPSSQPTPMATIPWGKLALVGGAMAAGYFILLRK